MSDKSGMNLLNNADKNEYQVVTQEFRNLNNECQINDGMNNLEKMLDEKN